MSHTPKRAVNLSIDSELLQHCKQLHINLSQALEQKLTELLREKTQQQWLQQNRVALEEYNRMIEKHGLFSDGLRRF